MAIILNSNGYSAHAAYNGETAVELAESLRPDIIISDVVMGEMSGVELAIHCSKSFPGCRIILISGQAATTDLIEQAAQLGYQFELLTKPVPPRKLLSHLASDRTGGVG